MVEEEAQQGVPSVTQTELSEDDIRLGGVGM